MTTSAEQTAGPLDSPAARRLGQDPIRPFYWSVRRELWENRSVWRAPMIIAGVILAGFLLALISGHHMNFDTPFSQGGPNVVVHGAVVSRQEMLAVIPYAVTAAIIVVTGIVVGAFYCLGALHGERRDRSILFWKSLPVSDLSTVLAKLALPMAAIPAVTFVVIVVMQLVMITLATAAMTSSGQDPGRLWSDVPLMRMWIMFVYALVANSLWQAPFWAWLLLVSAWARRMPILWALGVPIGVGIFERIAFGSHHLSDLFWDRILGGLGVAFDVPQHATTINFTDMTPVRYIAAPGLWIGLVIAAALVAATVWLRRRAEPI